MDWVTLIQVINMGIDREIKRMAELEKGRVNTFRINQSLVYKTNVSSLTLKVAPGWAT